MTVGILRRTSSQWETLSRVPINDITEKNLVMHAALSAGANMRTIKEPERNSTSISRFLKQRVESY